EGKMAIAGPFGKNDKKFTGLFIFPVATIREAERLAETDPAVKAGVFVVDYIPWFGSASLMATPEIHKKISKSLN
ncbi:MAG: YciI family protein, partial [Pyrinomonadaceae bacterium]